MRWMLTLSLVVVFIVAFVACESGVHHDSVATRDSAIAPSASPAAGAAGTSSPSGDKSAPGQEQPIFDESLQSGSLTAAEFDDVRHPAHYESFVRQMSEYQSHTRLAAAFADRPIVLTVHDLADVPLGGAVVEVESSSPQRRFTLTTRTDGRVVMFPGWDNLPINQPIPVSVRLPQHGGVIRSTITTRDADWRIAVPGVDATKPTQLDLAFVIDCTGSMSDELEYLKVEVRGIAKAIAEQFPGVTQRYALVAYRDQGDEYVTRRYDFTTSLATFINHLGRQSANGGGDYPEAVHDALADTGRLSWSKGNVARVAFHIADAPPHDNRIETALEAINILRAKGVATYPVAASGVRDLAEFTMRTEAMLTGARYVFLTDDSGVGHAHAEPHFPFYDLQKLNKLIVRMVAMELTGTTISPAPQDVVRRVRNTGIKPVLIVE